MRPLRKGQFGLPPAPLVPQESRQGGDWRTVIGGYGGQESPLFALLLVPVILVHRSVRWK